MDKDLLKASGLGLATTAVSLLLSGVCYLGVSRDLALIKAQESESLNLPAIMEEYDLNRDSFLQPNEVQEMLRHYVPKPKQIPL